MTINEFQEYCRKKVSKYIANPEEKQDEEKQDEENDSNQKPISKEEKENKEAEEKSTKITVRFIKKVK